MRIETLLILLVGIISVNLVFLNKRILPEHISVERKKHETIKKRQKEQKRQNVRKAQKRQRIEIVNVPADGDCFFHCFSEAMAESGRKISVKTLREIVAKSIANEDMLEILLAIYENAKSERDWDILQDFAFMHDVKTVNQLRERILTREYFGDEMAILPLELFFDVKATVFTSDPNRILKEMKRPGNLGPKRQNIALYLSGSSSGHRTTRAPHYQLLRVNGRYILDTRTISSLPYI